MTTTRRLNEFYTETKRVIVRDGEPEVKQTTCCCRMPGAKARECSDAQGHKTPCRCNCHRSRP